MFIGNFPTMPGGNPPVGLINKSGTLGYETMRPGGGPNISPYGSANVMNSLFSGGIPGMAGKASTNLAGGNSMPPGLSGMLNSYMPRKYEQLLP